MRMRLGGTVRYESEGIVEWEMQRPCLAPSNSFFPDLDLIYLASWKSWKETATLAALSILVKTPDRALSKSASSYSHTPRHRLTFIFSTHPVVFSQALPHFFPSSTFVAYTLLYLHLAYSLNPRKKTRKSCIFSFEWYFVSSFTFRG